MSSKNVGIFEAFYNSVNKVKKIFTRLILGFTKNWHLFQPITLLSETVELLPYGKLASGVTEIPFEFKLPYSKESRQLYETYHGVFVTITYLLKCSLKRSFLSKDVQKIQEFMIQYEVNQDISHLLWLKLFQWYRLLQPKPKVNSKVVNFSISPETLQKTTKERISIPRFLITGCLDTSDCCLTKPLSGLFDRNFYWLQNNRELIIFFRSCVSIFVTSYTVSKTFFQCI